MSEDISEAYEVRGADWARQMILEPKAPWWASAPLAARASAGDRGGRQLRRAT